MFGKKFGEERIVSYTKERDLVLRNRLAIVMGAEQGSGAGTSLISPAPVRSKFSPKSVHV